MNLYPHTNRNSDNSFKKESQSFFFVESWSIHKLLAFAGLTILISSCVSKREYNALLEDKNSVEDRLAELKVDETLEDYNQADDLHEKNEIIYEQKDQLMTARQELDSLTSIVKAQRNELEKALAVINKLTKDDWYIDELKGSLKIDLSANLLFPLNSDEVSEQGITLIESLATDISSLKNIEKVRVVGHTDNQKFDSDTYDNWNLSADRAIQVARLLQKNGINPKKLSAEARSFYEPILSNDTEAGRETNRRVEIEIVPKANISEALSNLIATQS